MDPEARAALDAYLDAEYALWRDAHLIRDDLSVFRAMDAFDDRFFTPDLASAISRPGGMDDAAFTTFSGRLSGKRRRQICGLRALPDGSYQALLTSDHTGFGDSPAELIGFTVQAGQLTVTQVRLPDASGHVGQDDPGPGTLD